MTFMLSNPVEKLHTRATLGEPTGYGDLERGASWLSLLSSPNTFSWYVSIRTLAVNPEPGDPADVLTGFQCVVLIKCPSGVSHSPKDGEVGGSPVPYLRLCTLSP